MLSNTTLILSLLQRQIILARVTPLNIFQIIQLNKRVCLTKLIKGNYQGK